MLKIVLVNVYISVYVLVCSHLLDFYFEIAKRFFPLKVLSSRMDENDFFSFTFPASPFSL